MIDDACWCGGDGSCHYMVLSDADRDAFLEALRRPPKPNEALARAFQLHHEMLERDDRDRQEEIEELARFFKKQLEITAAHLSQKRRSEL